jgi:hypothetical protein
VIRRLGRAVAVVCALAVLFGAGVGGRQVLMTLASHDADTIHACRNTTTGALRVVDSADDCRTTEEPLSWNTTGPAGPTGPQGPAGPAGPAGDEGDWLSRCFLEGEESTFDCAVEELKTR